MLDIKFVRENPEIVKQNIRNKFQDSKLELVDEVLKLDQENRDIKKEVEALRANRNKISKQIGALMAQGKKEEAEEIIDVSYQSAEMEVGFNVSYLLDVLNTLKCQRVRISLVDASSSCLIEDCDNATAEYVIMPMRL